MTFHGFPSLDDVPAGNRIFIKDSRLQFIYCNDSLAHDLGLPPSRVVGSRDDDHYPQEIAKANGAEERYVLETGNKLNQIKSHHSGNRDLWARMTKEPYLDESGNICGVIGIMEVIGIRSAPCGDPNASCTSDCDECSPYIYWELDLENRDFFISEGWREMFDAGPDWTPPDPKELLLHDEHGQVLQILRQAAEHQHFFNLQHRIKVRNNVFWVYNQGGVYRDVRNGRMIMHGIIRSDSKCRRKESYLNLYNHSFEISELPMLFLNKFGNIILRNSAFLKLWNLDSREALNRNIKDYITANKKQYREIFLSLKQEGGWKGSLKGRRLDGSLFNVYVSLSSTLDYNGTISYIMATILDLTERIKLEERNTQLANQFETLLKTTQDAFFQVDMQGYFKAVNKKACDLMGYDSSRLLTMHIRDLEVVGTRRQIAEMMNRITEIGSAQFKSKLKTASGEIIDVQLSILYLPDDRCYFTFIRDISDSEALFKDLLKAQMELEEKNTALKVVLSTHINENEEKERHLNKKVQKTIMPLLNRLASDASPSQLNLIEQIRQNLHYIDSTKDDDLSDKLNTREFQIAQNIAQGLSSKEIAGLQGFSVRTVESYRVSIRKKLGLAGPSVNLRHELEERLFS